MGYDVWLTNNRGNVYSMGHCTLQNIGTNPEYWDYCLDELIKYDILSNIEYILKITGKEKVVYIGHS